MKKIAYILILFLTLSSCEELVKEEVFSTITPNNFFKSQKDLLIAVNGVYDGLQTNNVYHINLNNLMVGEFINNWPFAFQTLVITNTTGELWTIWSENFKTIGKANEVLAKLEKFEMDKTLKDRYAAEVRYLRAFCYFNMVRTFGHFPLAKSAPSSLDQVVTPDPNAAGAYESEYLKQVDRDVIYDFIIEDLKFCEQALPAIYGAADFGRVTKGAASGMLARVYLFQAGLYYDYNTGGLKPGDNAKYALCAQKCQEIITSGTYSLLPDYSTLFLNSNENNSEMIFQVQYMSSKESGVTGEGAVHAPEYGIRGSDITPYSYNQNAVNSVFFNDWVSVNGTTDKRYSTTFQTSYVNKSGVTINWGTGNFRGPLTRKLLSDIELPINATTPFDYGDNLVVQRYADVLLMHSEALNESGTSPDANTLMGINKIRVRAGKPELTLPITKEALREEIWKERKWELCFEGFYLYFDCQRTGRYLTEVAKYYHNRRLVTPSDKYNIMPIPYQATQTNPSLMQNFGW